MRAVTTLLFGFSSMSTYTRPVLLLLSGLLLLTICLAVLNTLVPLWLNERQWSVWQVGLVGTGYFTGNLVGTLLAGRLIHRWGFNRSYYLAAAIFALATGMLGVSSGMWGWLVWRFVAGVACALIWVVVESALLCSGHAVKRGQLLAAYMMSYYFGSVLGQLLLGMVPSAQGSILPWLVMLVLAAMFPLVFARIPPPQPVTHHAGVWRMLRYRRARLGIDGCIISGVILGSLYGLMPLYLAHQGMSDAQVGYWMALLISAGIAGQWPVGRLADRFGRLMVLRVLVFAVVMGALAVLGMGSAGMAFALCLLGAAGFTLYPVAMSWACERVAPDELVAMNQALLLSYTIGSLCGPSLAALLMQAYSDAQLFVLIAVVALGYLILLLKKTDHHPRPLPV